MCPTAADSPSITWQSWSVSRKPVSEQLCCLGHLAPDDFEQAIKRAKTEGLDARGVTLTPSLLDRIFSLLDRTNQDAPIVSNARFARATFSGEARFGGATFSGDTGFARAIFTGDTGFVVSLSGKLSFLSVRAAKRLWLALRDDSTEGDSTVDLTAASFAGPAVVAASPAGAGSRRPRLVSLEQTDTANLMVPGLDLSDCRFLGVVNLDRLRIDGSLLLRSAPGWWRAQWQVLWEEGKLRGWWGRKAPNLQDGPEADRDHRERASRLQAVYRELRKGREDAKDEPGRPIFIMARWRCASRRLAAWSGGY